MTDAPEHDPLPDPAALVADIAPRRRSRIIVELDLDPVPGWGNAPEDHQRMLEHYLDTAVGHYHPAVTIEPAATAPAGTLTDTEREEFVFNLAPELADTLEQMGVEDATIGDGRTLADTVYCLGYRLPEAAVAAALAPIEARIAAERCREVHPERSVTCRACKSWAAHVAALAGGGDRG